MSTDNLLWAADGFLLACVVYVEKVGRKEGEKRGIGITRH